MGAASPLLPGEAHYTGLYVIVGRTHASGSEMSDSRDARARSFCEYIGFVKRFHTHYRTFTIKTSDETDRTASRPLLPHSSNKLESRKLASRRPTCPESYNASRSVLTMRDPILSLECENR